MIHLPWKSTVLLVLILTFTLTSNANTYSVTSPDGRIKFQSVMEMRYDNQAVLFYRIQHKNQRIIAPSNLGFSFQNGDRWPEDIQVQTVTRSSRNETVSLVYGERSTIPNQYNEIILGFSDASEIVVRAYNEGIAFRYVLNQIPAKTINQELTQFNFTKDFMAWEEHGTEGDYKKTPISTIKPKCETPLTVELKPGGPYACVMEAAVIDYPRMWLTPAKGQSHALTAQLGSDAVIEDRFQSPWRVIMFADRPGELVEQNYFLLNLNPPSAIQDTSWIKPGKVMRCTRLNTEWGKKYINFAEEHNIDYIHFDAGWYGPERDPASDPRKPKDDLDLQEVIDYAKGKGVGITVYVNRIALDKYWKELFPLYKKWGIKGIKFGFVAVGPQVKMKWLYDAVAWAGENHLIVDIHDSYRPSGFSHTLPNLLTQEGIQGNEHMPVAEHNVTLPFTRYPSGAGDYTICYYSDRIKNTHAHQLAASVVMYSPMQFLFWYDNPSQYQGEPEIELFENLPVVWDESRVLNGAIGDYIIMARRSGDEWYVTALVDGQERKFKIAFDFLKPGQTYEAHIYSDDPSPDKSRTGVKIERIQVNHSTILPVTIPATGGYTVRCVPATR